MCTGNNWYKCDSRFEYYGHTIKVEDIPRAISENEGRGWYFDHTAPVMERGREGERWITFYR